MLSFEIKVNGLVVYYAQAINIGMTSSDKSLTLYQVEAYSPADELHVKGKIKTFKVKHRRKDGATKLVDLILRTMAEEKEVR